MAMRTFGMWQMAASYMSWYGKLRHSIDLEIAGKLMRALHC